MAGEEKIAEIPSVDANIEPDDALNENDSPLGAQPQEEAETEEETVEAGEETDEEEAEEKKPETKPWQTKQVGKLRAKMREMQQELEQLRASNQKPIEDKETYTKEEMAEIVRRESDKKAAEARQAEFINSHNKAVDSIVRKAGKIDKTFDENLSGMIDNLGDVPMPLQLALVEAAEDAPAVLNFIAANPDKAEELYSMTPHRMAVEIGKLTARLAKTKEPEPLVKKNGVSKAPKPPPDINGNSSANDVLHDKMTDAQWMAMRNKQARERGLPR